MTTFAVLNKARNPVRLLPPLPTVPLTVSVFTVFNAAGLMPGSDRSSNGMSPGGVNPVLCCSMSSCESCTADHTAAWLISSPHHQQTNLPPLLCYVLPLDKSTNHFTSKSHARAHTQSYCQFCVMNKNKFLHINVISVLITVNMHKEHTQVLKLLRTGAVLRFFARQE